MPRSFLVKKKGDRIFRSYRSDGSDALGVVGKESAVVAKEVFHDPYGGRLTHGPHAVWPLVSDEVKNANDVIRDSASDLFLPLPALVQPLAIRVKNSNGYMFDSSPFLFPRRFPLDGSPFYSADCTEVIQPIDLLSHRGGVAVADRSKVIHRELDSSSTEEDLAATVELKTLECCTNITTNNSSSISIISPISPHSSNSLDFSPNSAAQRSEASSAHSSISSGSSSNHSAGGGSSGSRRCNAFQDGITVGYTYDAFFVSDGRSRRRNALGITEPTRQRYKCSECGKHYATSSNLSRHKQTHRSLDSQQAKQCPHCHKVYVSMPALSMHILTHDLKYTCTVCAKAFSRPWLLQGHLRSHTGEKPFGCAHCGKAFADRSNLRAHMQTHSSFKLYTCKRCNKSFALKAYLNKHLESACFKDNEGEEEGEVDDDCCSEASIWSV